MAGKDEKLSRTVQLETGMAITFACTPPRTADVLLFELLNIRPPSPDDRPMHDEV